MIIDDNFMRVAQGAFYPFSPYSGTEHVAPLLYSLARLIRPKIVVEYGSGYTTLFLLAALAENSRDTEEEAVLLREKTAALYGLKSANLGPPDLLITEWFEKGAKACGVDPAYYLNLHAPHL